MNRRNFIRGLLTAAAGFTILPGAGRIWKAERKIVNPAWVNAPYEVTFFHYRDFGGVWRFVSDEDALRLERTRTGIYRAIFAPPTEMCPTTPPPC